MSFWMELSVQQKQTLGLPVEERFDIELIPPEHTPIWFLRKENPFLRLGLMRVGNKTITLQEHSVEWLRKAYPHIKNLATLESFPAHIKAIEARIKGSP